MLDARKLKAENIILRNQISQQGMLIKNQNKKIAMYEEKMEVLVNVALEKAVAQVKNKYNKIIKELNNKIAVLEAKLNKDSSNSSLPSSMNCISKKMISNTREKTNRTIGGQPGHKQHKLDYFKDEEEFEEIVHTLSKCSECQSKLEYKKTVISDIIDFDVTIKRNRNKIQQYYCPLCKKELSGNTFLPRGTSYGSNINASSIILMNDANVPINKVRKYYIGLTNNEINMSEGYLSKLQSKTAKLLETFSNDLKEQLLKEKVIHWDDTVITVGTKQGILRFYGNEKLAYLIGHETKNSDGIKEDGILQKLSEATTVVHDHILYNYNADFKFKNAECNAHILRYLKGVTDNIHTHTWEKKLAKLLKEVNAARNGKDHFDADYIKEVYEKYEEIIILGYKENLELVEYHFYKDEELKLIKRLDKYREAHLLFIKDFNVPFSNNTAEKSFRISKTKMKVSGLFQNITPAKNYAVILSYMETCYRNGINKLQAIKRLHEGNPYTVQELLELKQ